MADSFLPIYNIFCNIILKNTVAVKDRPLERKQKYFKIKMLRIKGYRAIYIYAAIRH